MYDASAQLPGCVVDPPYDPAYCGFNDAPGCLPLNGCGDESVFPLLVVFTMINAFVCLNLFVGVVLAEYESFTSVLLTTNHTEAFENLWYDYCDATNTSYMEMRKVEEFVAELSAPLGFEGADYSPLEMAKRIGKKEKRLLEQ